MKLSIVALLCSLGSTVVAVPTLSQQSQLDVSYRNETLGSVLTDLKRRTGYQVMYLQEVVPENALVTITRRNAEIRDILTEILTPHELTFTIREDMIIIVPSESSQVQQQSEPQRITVAGTVRSAQGVPLPGVVVLVKGTQRGATTDAAGRFTLTYSRGEGNILVFSIIGMERVELEIGTRREFNVTMNESAIQVGNVIVTGIFDRASETYTGAVTTIRREQLERVGNQNLIQTLRNIDPSFYVIESNEFGSDPNRLPDIQMRGPSNFSDMRDKYQTSPNQPLFILDGFETTLTRIMDLDMNRVESVTLLKDATAQALYGSRGANGVVVIETVTPEMGRLRVTYTSDLSIIAPDLTSYNLANAAEKLEIERRAGVFTSTIPTSQMLLDEQYNRLYNEVLRGVDTYWLSKPLRTAFGNRHSLFFEGGDDAFRYGIDFGYNNIQGVMKGSGREVISGSMNFQYRYGKFIFRDQLSVDFNKATNSPYGNFSEYSRLNPYWRTHNEDGSLREILGSYANANSQGYQPIYNPLINASLNSKAHSSYMSVINNFYAEYLAFEGMRFKGRFGLVAQRDDSDHFLPRDHTTFRNISVESDEYFNRGRYTMSTGKSFDYNADISANYSGVWDKHVLFANAQWSLGERRNESVSFSAVGFGNNRIDYITFARQYPQTGSPTGSESLRRDASILASTNYSFDQRFLFDASFRYDGSSLFGADKRWSKNWSTGVGWNLHKEHFLMDVSWLERLRLRASTGFIGSQNFRPYDALATYMYYSLTYDNIIGAYQLGIANPNLKWQRTQSHNIGIDIESLDALDITFDYYVRNTRDVLTPVSMPPSSGFSEYTENLGHVRNTGFETRINYHVIRDRERDMRLTVFASGMHNKNKLLKISDALSAFNDERDNSKGTQNANTETNHLTNKHVTRPTVRYIEGASMNAIWAVKSLGIDPWTGREIFVKADGTYTTVWDPADYIIAGDSEPKFAGTFGFTFNYKGFSVNSSFYFRLGGQYYNQTLVEKVENADIQYNVDRRMYTDRWSADTAGQAAKFKAFSNTARFTRPTTRFIQDFNELQMTSLNVGYDFRYAGFVNEGSVFQRVRLQFYCIDLFRVSTVKTERGIQYPFARTFSLKIQATF